MNLIKLPLSHRLLAAFIVVNVGDASDLDKEALFMFFPPVMEVHSLHYALSTLLVFEKASLVRRPAQRH